MTDQTDDHDRQLEADRAGDIDEKPSTGVSHGGYNQTSDAQYNRYEGMTMVVKSEKSRRRQSEREKANRIKRRRAKICTRCGKRKPPAGRVQCGRCGELNRSYLAVTRLRPRILWGKQDELRDQQRSREIFDLALLGEKFGHHPGFADISVRAYTYCAISQRVSRIRSPQLDLYVSSYDELREAFEIMRMAIADWLAGVSPYTRRQIFDESPGPDFVNGMQAPTP